MNDPGNLKAVIEVPVDSVDEYVLMKERAKLSNETWRLIDQDHNKVLDKQTKGGL